MTIFLLAGAQGNGVDRDDKPAERFRRSSAASVCDITLIGVLLVGFAVLRVKRALL